MSIRCLPGGRGAPASAPTYRAAALLGGFASINGDILYRGNLVSTSSIHTKTSIAEPRRRSSATAWCDWSPIPARRSPLLAQVLKVDDRVVDWLHGQDELAPALAAVARRSAPGVELAGLALAPALGERLVQLARELRDTPDRSPVLYLQGPRGAGKRTVAEALARAAGRGLLALDGAALDGPDEAVEAAIHAAAREARLTGDLLLCERADLVLAGDRRRPRAALLAAIADLAGPLVLAGASAGELRDRAVLRVELALPDARARAALWRAASGDAPLAGDIDLAAHAARLALGAGQIHDAAATARGIARLRSRSRLPGAPVRARRRTPA